MAFIKFSALVSSVVGKLNGSYFQSQKGGTSLKNIGNRRARAASGQQSLQVAQNRLSTVAREWQQLAEGDSLAWSSYASAFERINKNSIRYVPTGYQMFCECNSNRLKIGSSILELPNTPSAEFSVDNLALEMESSTSMILSSEVAIPADKMVVVSASAPTFGNKKYPPSGYKAILNVSSATSLPVNLYSAYAVVWGEGNENAQYFFKFEIVDIGSGISEGSKLTKADAG